MTANANDAGMEIIPSEEAGKAKPATKKPAAAKTPAATKAPAAAKATAAKTARPAAKSTRAAKPAAAKQAAKPGKTAAAVPVAKTSTSVTVSAAKTAVAEPAVTSPAPAKKAKPATKTTRTAKTVASRPAAKTAVSEAQPVTAAQVKTSASVAANSEPHDPKRPTKPLLRASPIAGGVPEATIGTDAAFAPEHPPVTEPCLIRNVSEARHFFRTNDVPVFFVGATPFNLLGLDRWVRNFSYISYYDAWDGAHPRVFTPANKPPQAFESAEEINNWLLLNAEVRARMAKDLRPGMRPKVAMVFFNEETEHICQELGYDLILPSAELRNRLDSKIIITRLGNEAGVPSVPNVLTKGTNWSDLRAAADKAGLGDSLVVQTPYGDSGKTTYFIANEADWDNHAEGIVGEEIKVMRRINNRPVAVEAVLTRSGTVVGPFLSELCGHSDLTPYEGGWCGNEMHPEVLSASQRARATELVKRMGGVLDKEGYRGFFEVDVLVDTDTDEVYLGELNPRISGASAITNVTAGAYADVPLFLFHLLEYMGVEFDLNIEEINERWEALSGADVWSQMIIKETHPVLEQLTAAPATGQYFLDANGAMVFNRAALDWHMLQSESEAFFLRIYGPGDYRWNGSDLGVLVTKGRLQVHGNGTSTLNIRAQHFIDCLRAEFAGVPVDDSAPADSVPGIGLKA